MNKIYGFLEDLREALDKLYYKDQHLIHYGDGYHVSERSVTHKLGAYLGEFIKDYDVDCEYNRAGDDIKQIKLNQNIVPDIIVHRRGVDEDNFVAIEVKPWWNRNTSKDEDKLETLSEPNSMLKYNCGISLLLGKRRDEIRVKLFIDGKKVEEIYPF